MSSPVRHGGPTTDRRSAVPSVSAGTTSPVYVFLSTLDEGELSDFGDVALEEV
jgi:hypothetical protein